MKSIVLKSLRQPKSDDEPLRLDSTVQIKFNQDFDICIFSKCELKSIKGPGKALLDSYKASQEKISPIKEDTSACLLNEQDFLYKDLLKKKAYLTSHCEQLENSNEIDKELNENEDSNESLRESYSCERAQNSRRKDYDLLSKATVYSKTEIIKIFKAKIHKLDILYKKQLAIINDQILLSRKQYLTMKDQPNSRSKKVSSKHIGSLKKYKKQSNSNIYLKKKYGKLTTNQDTETSCINGSLNQTCQYNEGNSNSHPKNVGKCEYKSLPLTNYCQKHILNDKNQILFSRCPGNTRPDNPVAKQCKRPLIESIGLVCPIHISNKFIDCNLDLTDEELLTHSDSNTNPRESLTAANSTSSMHSIQNNEENIETNEATSRPSSQVETLINNVKLISVIKQESFDDFE